jgi:hypothetical protein
MGSKPVLNATGLADRYGVSPQAVTKAARAGQLDGAFRWDVAGKKRTMVVTDLPLMDRLWMSRPGARAPGLERSRAKDAASAAAPQAERAVDVLPCDGDSVSDLATERLRLERYKAKNEQLEFERASGKLIELAKIMAIYEKNITEAKTAFRGLGKRMRARSSTMTVDDEMLAEDLCDEILGELAAKARGIGVD